MKNKPIIYILSLSSVVFSLFFFYSHPAKAQFEFLGDILNQFIGTNVQNVRIIGDNSEASLTTAIKTTLSAITGERTSNALEQLVFKEQVLDPAAWGVAKKLQQQLTGDLLKWLGGQQPGQNGEVPFVQDYSEYYQGVVDQVAADYIYNDKAGAASGQCATSDPEKEHRVLVALRNSYVSEKQKAEGGGALRCEESDNDSYKNATDRLLGDFLTCKDEACATFAGWGEMAWRAENALEAERQMLTISRGMKPQRVCQTVTNSNGTQQTECPLINPPFLAADTTSFNVVQMPGFQLLNMDEFNEIASNLMNNLANQALQGLTGVLGLSGNPSYSQNVFGVEGNLSYVDALVRDDISRYQTGSESPIKPTLDIEIQFFGIQSNILSTIGELEAKLAENKEQFSSCFDLELTDRLKEIKTKASTDATISSTTIAILTVLNTQYNAATTDAATRNTVLVTYADYKNQGFFHTTYQIQELQISFVNLEFARLVDKFRYDMALERQSCGGDFDYDGILDDNDT